MKRNRFAKVVAFAVFILCAAGCGKDNILWLDPVQEYDVVNIRGRNPNGGWDEMLPGIFPNASRIVFRKEGLCDHNIGYIDVTNTTQTFRYNFDWYKRSQKKIGLAFAQYDEVIAGQPSGAVSVARLLSRDYDVYEDSKNPNHPAFAGVVVLRSPDLEIVLKSTW